MVKFSAIKEMLVKIKKYTLNKRLSIMQELKNLFSNALIFQTVEK